MDIFLFVVISFLFGFFTDFADLLDEHGLKWFEGADVLFGLAWGICGAYMILTNTYAGLFVISLVLYWLLRGKLDYPNHALAGAIVFLSSFWFFSNNTVSLTYVVAPLAVLLLTWRIEAGIKSRYRSWGSSKIVVLIKHLIAPISLSLMLVDLYPVYFFLFSIIGSKISDRWFENFVKTNYSGLAKTLGMSLKEGAHN